LGAHPLYNPHHTQPQQRATMSMSWLWLLMFDELAIGSGGAPKKALASVRRSPAPLMSA
jgi:hypothetical protein